MKKKFNNVLVVLGGNSGERAVSLESGRACIKALKKKGYKVKIFDPKIKNFNLINKKNIDVIFNALHGKDGEDGVAQSYFEYLKIPYTHSGVISSYNSMNKIISKEIFKKNNIKTPKFISIKKSELKKNIIQKELSFNKIRYPIVLKPINEGSSLGVEVCKDQKKLLTLINKLFKKYDELILEEYIGGQEVQVAVINGKPVGAIELIPRRLFYDYKAKYTKKAKTKHIMPANLTRQKYKEVLNIAKKTHKVLNCRGVTRSDFKFYKNNFYILEINTQPGMTSLSLVPEIASYEGINFENLVEKILLDASINK
ncbi:MAG: D-alanine--D-alanine ligase [Candidatus Pelagibacter sp. TMED286]|nr:MAG: D-alanine--D-alanine ligase [Pelagibacterales bacterium MED-G43]RPG95159.1 MAG: D-alanine--D-alanine ligase [Candidatus Pelagibacter sp. TMED286]